MKEEICGKQPPPYWKTMDVCTLPKGHKIEFVLTPKLKKRKVTKGHRLRGGAEWPIGTVNLQYE